MKCWKLLLGLMVVGEFAVTAYGCLVVWLMAAWMVDDSEAFRMSTLDWYREGAGRFLFLGGVGIVWAITCRFINGRVVKMFTGATPRWLGVISVVAGGLVVLSALAGSVVFVVTKPYI